MLLSDHSDTDVTEHRPRSCNDGICALWSDNALTANACWQPAAMTCDESLGALGPALTLWIRPSEDDPRVVPAAVLALGR
jgi:hypothetical protein